MNLSLFGIWLARLPVALLFLPMPVFLPMSGEPDRWVVRDQRGAVEVYSEFNPSLPVLWGHLKDVREELGELLPLRPSGEPIQIMLFRSREGYLNYLTRRIPEARQRKAIFFLNEGTCQIYAVQNAQLMTDLRHEFTHALLHQELPFLPLWIDEGLAEFLEEPAAARQRSARLASVRWKSRFGWKPSLRHLEDIPAAADMTADDYRDSWAWIEFLLNESPVTRQILSDYLATIAQGEAPGPFSQYLAGRDPAAGNRIKSYFQKIRFSVNSAQE